MKIITNSCKVILTTAYNEYAIEGYERWRGGLPARAITFDRYADRCVQKPAAFAGKEDNRNGIYMHLQKSIFL